MILFLKRQMVRYNRQLASATRLYIQTNLLVLVVIRTLEQGKYLQRLIPYQETLKQPLFQQHLRPVLILHLSP